MRHELAGDPHRPRYHFLAPANWMNDPHGLIVWEGEYHLFYQYNPHGAFHDSIHWGHAASQDLVHWRDLPIALAPGPEAYDQDGCWTGCAVADDGLPVIFYTSVYPQTVSAAVSHDGLLTWEKLLDNPLIDGPPESLRPQAGGHFRDPFIWRAGDGWLMLMASKIEGQGGQVLLYHSADLRHWTYRGVFLGGNSQVTEPFWQGTMWECPNLLDFGARQALLVSVQSTPTDHLYTAYFSGRVDGEVFAPEHSDILVHGGSFYAPQVLRLADGRYLMFGWLHEGRSQQACLEAGWNGAHSLPLIVGQGPDDALAVTPAAELRALRRRHWHEEGIPLAGATELTLPGVRGKALEIFAEFVLDEAAECGLKVLCSPGGEEETRIVYRPDTAQIFVERLQASLDQRADVNAATMPVSLAPGDTLRLHIFIDHSVLELFANDTLCLACRVYPTRADSSGLRLFSRQGQAMVARLDIWQLASVWPSE